MVSINSVATEPAVFELACVLNNIKHIVICGHSDCKAVNMLYDIHTDPDDEAPTSFSPLRAWVTTHGNRSIAEFFRLEAAQFRTFMELCVQAYLAIRPYWDDGPSVHFNASHCWVWKNLKSS